MIAADFSRTTGRHGKRGERYVLIEAGHAGQNISLQAMAMGLATVMVGALSDEEVAQVVSLGSQYQPLYVIPVGHSGICAEGSNAVS